MSTKFYTYLVYSIYLVVVWVCQKMSSFLLDNMQLATNSINFFSNSISRCYFKAVFKFMCFVNIIWTSPIWGPRAPKLVCVWKCA